MQIRQENGNLWYPSFRKSALKWLPLKIAIFQKVRFNFFSDKITRDRNSEKCFLERYYDLLTPFWSIWWYIKKKKDRDTAISASKNTPIFASKSNLQFLPNLHFLLDFNEQTVILKLWGSSVRLINQTCHFWNNMALLGPGVTSLWVKIF